MRAYLQQCVKICKVWIEITDNKINTNLRIFMKRIGIIFGLLGLLNTGAVVYEHEENGAKFYLYNEYIPINSQLFFKNLKTLNNVNIDDFYCSEVDGGLDSITKLAQKKCDAITDRYNKKKLQLARAETTEEIGYLTGNDWMGINSDNQMYAQLLSYARILAPYNLCDGISTKDYEKVFLRTLHINDRYKSVLINRYGSADKTSRVLYEQQDYLLEREKARLVNKGIPSSMCNTLKSENIPYLKNKLY